VGPRRLFRAAGAAKPSARPFLGLDPASVLGDPCFGIGFGGERADLGRIALRDDDFDAKRPVGERDHAGGHCGQLATLAAPGKGVNSSASPGTLSNRPGFQCSAAIWIGSERQSE
jgi:hypothetical protein